MEMKLPKLTNISEENDSYEKLPNQEKQQETKSVVLP